MLTVTVRTRLSAQAVRDLVRSLPGILSGRLPDPTGNELRQSQLLMGQTLLMHIKLAFAEKAAGGTDAAGQTWKPLAPSTLKGRRKGKGAGSPQILRDTGRLLNSFSPGVDLNLLDIRPGEVTIGTNVSYAVYHHQGTETIPARPLWPKVKDWPDHWKEDIQSELIDGIIRMLTRSLEKA